MQFEYKIIDLLHDGSCDSEFELNELGKENWQLVAIHNYKFYFMRLVTTFYGPAFETPPVEPVIQCIHSGSYIDSSGWHCPVCKEHKKI